MRKTLRKRLFLSVVLLAVSLVRVQPVLAAGEQWAAGLILGEPSGFTAKRWLDPKSAIDLGLAFSFNSFVLFYGDYLLHFPNGFAKANDRFIQQLTPYVGAGATMLISTNSSRTDGKYFTTGGSSVGFGFRLPVGIEWRPAQPPLGIFLELVPGMGLIPSTFGFFQGGLGARWYF